jgi:glucose dehydrogenase
MKPTLGSLVGVFSTVVAAALVAGVAHQPVEASDKGAKPYTTWSNYEGRPDSAQYSALTQINKSNVTQLQQVWFYPGGNKAFVTATCLRYLSRRISNVAVPRSLIDRLIVHC